MKKQIQQWKTLLKGKTLAAVLMLALTASFGSYEFLKPADASAASIAPAAAALDDNSVSALSALDHAMETLAAHVTPAVVNVTVTSRAKQQQQMSGRDQDEIQRFFGPFGFGQQGPQGRQGPRVEHGLGSGIIISPDGYIVTNNHVIDGATDIRVTLNDRRVLPAKLVGADPMTDLAVIKISGSGFPSLPWGDSTALKPGQTVLAFGNPFNFRFTVTRGIVSALNRPNPYSDDARKPGEFIQTDAAINPGNSGGPLVNAHGEVIGINTFLISPSGSFSGMGFAIPTQIARPVVDTLLKDGKIEHARIGVGINDVTPENATFFHMDNASGALVSQVEPDSPGAKAGLKVGDVITELNGKKMDNSGQLQAAISAQRPGGKVNLVVMRDGKSLSLPVTLESINKKSDETASNRGEGHGKARWGVALENLNADMRDQMQLPSEVKGVLVTNVQPGSPADNAGISRGDVILEVNRRQVQTADDVRRELGNVPSGKDAMVLIWANGGSSFRVMHAAEPGADQNGD
ncbi:MAG TPA: Do family serine endopeptidase [Candidatus Dormibacteraeota bacterium]|nr:Do family serine endopeptidase [Candidatus Dormibacteraeota bacterium]